jgi:hypothetical protein
MVKWFHLRGFNVQIDHRCPLLSHTHFDDSLYEFKVGFDPFGALSTSPNTTTGFWTEIAIGEDDRCCREPAELRGRKDDVSIMSHHGLKMSVGLYHPSPSYTAVHHGLKMSVGLYHPSPSYTAVLCPHPGARLRLASTAWTRVRPSGGPAALKPSVGFVVRGGSTAPCLPRQTVIKRALVKGTDLASKDLAKPLHEHRHGLPFRVKRKIMFGCSY